MVAMRAAVPEELDDFDLAGRRIDGCPLVQRQVLDAVLRRLGLCGGQVRQARRGSSEDAGSARGKLTSIHILHSF